MDPEDIVRSLAAKNPIRMLGIVRGEERRFVCSYCACTGQRPEDIKHAYGSLSPCLWYESREWVSEHPERGERGYLRWYNDDGSPVEMGEFTKVTFNPPFSPQYDLIGDAEQAQGPADG